MTIDWRWIICVKSYANVNQSAYYNVQAVEK